MAFRAQKVIRSNGDENPMQNLKINLNIQKPVWNKITFPKKT